MSDTPRIGPVSAKYQGADPWYVVANLERDLAEANKEIAAAKEVRLAILRDHEVMKQQLAAMTRKRDAFAERWRKTDEEVERLRGKYEPIEKVCAYIDGRLRCLHCETLLAEEKADVERLRALLVRWKGHYALPQKDESALVADTNAALGEE